jgi:hypothetical protein
MNEHPKSSNISLFFMKTSQSFVPLSLLDFKTAIPSLEMDGQEICTWMSIVKQNGGRVNMKPLLLRLTCT